MSIAVKYILDSRQLRKRNRCANSCADRASYIGACEIGLRTKHVDLLKLTVQYGAEHRRDNEGSRSSLRRKIFFLSRYDWNYENSASKVSGAALKTFDLCCCGSGQKKNACCSRWHAGEAAPSAEALMRSRYAAFVVCDEHYLLATWHSRTRPLAVAFDSGQKWLGLKIVDAKLMSTEAAEIEFIARYRIGGGSAARLQERSRFVKENSRWFYVDGDMIK